MSRLPSVPPPSPADENVNANPDAGQTGLHTIGGGPATAEAPPPGPSQPAQMPITQGSAQQDQAAFITDEQFLHEFLKEDHTVPKVVLVSCVALTLAIYGYRGFALSDPGAALAAAFGSCVLAAILLCIAALTATAAGWVVSKIFGEDYGSVGVLFLRFSAVAAAQFPVFEATAALVGGFLALFLAVPIMLALVVWVAGLDLIRAVFFTVILCLVNWLLFAFVAVSIATAVS
jgi:hypothetical protein